MKSKLFPFKTVSLLALAAGMLLTVLPTSGFCGGWFLPAKYPAGEYHRFWAIGLSVPTLEQNVGMRTMKDGTHIYDFKNGNGAGHIYLWDRISDQYSCPAVASTDPSFKTYTTMDGQNTTFLKNVYEQLGELWSNGRNKDQAALMTKLRCTITSLEGRG